MYKTQFIFITYHRKIFLVFNGMERDRVKFYTERGLNTERKDRYTIYILADESKDEPGV
jgi:hypothetical protein